jgi:DNA-binding GntR family transcriptional regulator
MSRSAEKLISQIKQDIADGLLKPGDQLEEAALSERFGVSRTPIREAVRSMVDSGLLETRPRKGAFVRTMSAKELLDLFDVAAELEAMASRVAAEKLRQSDVQLIKSGLDACYAAAESDDAKAYCQANLDFHRAIHKASGNYWLIEQLKQIELHINAYRSMPYEVRGRMEKSVQEHQEIFDAIMEADGEKARILMRDHMMLQGQRLPSLIQALENQ